MTIWELLPAHLRHAWLRDLRRIRHRDDATSWCAARVRVHNRWTVELVRDGRVIDAWAFENLVVTEGLNLLLNRTFDAVASDVNWYIGLIGAGAGTVAVNAGSASVTGTGTSFDSGLATAPAADMIIVGAGTSGADHVSTVASVTNATSLTLADNAGTTVSGASYATELIAGDTLASHIDSWAEITPYSNGTRPAWTKNGSASGGAMSNSNSKASFSINATSRVFGAFLATNSTKGGTTGSLYGGGLFTSTGSRAVQNGDTLNVQVDLSVTAS